jgi:response regulator RpfG family c-di-GMP phosphodiesterase
MHDIGKVGIPDGILLKPGTLDAMEMDVIRRHALIGYEILKNSPSHYLQLGATIARYHHEKYDGSGYPEGLKGEEIPLAARIVAVVDVFDALTTMRPYKQAWPLDEALDYLRANAGSHFDPRCIDAFLRRLDEIRMVYGQLQDTGVQGPDCADGLPDGEI